MTDTELIEEKQHTFFPEEAREYEQEVKKILGINVHIIITPRVGQIDNPHPELEDIPQGTNAFVSDKRSGNIYLNPSMTHAIFFYFQEPNVDPEIAFNLLLQLKDGATQFLAGCDKEPNSEVPNNLQLMLHSLNDFFVSYEAMDFASVIEHLDNLSSEGRDPLITTFFMKVMWPLLQQYPVITTLAIKNLRPYVIHEATHVLLVEKTALRTLTQEDLSKLFTVTNPLTISKLRDFTATVTRDQPVDDQIVKIREEGVAKLSILLQHIPDQQLRRRYALHAFWGGLNESAARALSLAETGDEKQLYTAEHYNMYFASTFCFIDPGGNKVIRQLEEVYKQRGLNGFIDQVKASKSEMETEADALLQKIQ